MVRLSTGLNETCFSYPINLPSLPNRSLFIRKTSYWLNLEIKLTTEFLGLEASSDARFGLK